MPCWTHPDRRHLLPELLDDPALSRDETEHALRDLHRVLWWSLGLGPVARTVLPRLDAGPRRQSLLDLGTGSGEVPAVLRSRARRRGIELEVTGLDAKIGHLLVGRSLDHRMRRVAAGARHLPFPPGAFDWTLSTLFLHHFPAADARLVLAEMRRVARLGAVVVDVRPSRLAPLLFRLLSAVLRLGPVADSDGRLSLRQAWSLREVRALLGSLPVVELRSRFPFRFSLVLEAGS